MYCGETNPMERKIPQRRCVCSRILSGVASGIARVACGIGATRVIVVMIVVIALVRNAAVIMFMTVLFVMARSPGWFLSPRYLLALGS
jgi:hypothetical protein